MCICCMEERTLPIYKFGPCPSPEDPKDSPNAIDYLLRQRRFRFGSLARQNDVSEFAFPVKNPGDPVRHPSEMSESQASATRDIVESLVSSRIREKMAKQFGVCCFTRNPVNPVMWANYANTHRGICIGFRRNAKVFSPRHISLRNPFDHRRSLEVMFSVQPVVYGDYSPATCPATNLISMLTTKRPEWQYEEEERCYNILSGDEAFEPFEADDVIEIVIGARIDKRHAYEILELRNQQFPHAQLKWALPDPKTLDLRGHTLPPGCEKDTIRLIDQSQQLVQELLPQ